jgi:hypothetical protein
MSLLDKAQALRTRAGSKRQVMEDEVELAIAWFHGRVTNKQVAHALGRKTGATAWCSDVLKIALATQRADLVAVDPNDKE